MCLSPETLRFFRRPPETTSLHSSALPCLLYLNPPPPLETKTTMKMTTTTTTPVPLKKRKGLDDILEIDGNVFPSDIVVDHDGRGGMALSQVSGMTSSPARMGDNTSAGAGSGSVAEDTATAASARTGNIKC